MMTLDPRGFLEEVAVEVNGDFPTAFKLLGFFIFMSQEGEDTLFSENMISRRTYFRWLRIIAAAGWGDLLVDARLRQVIQDYLWTRFAGLPIDQARDRVLRVVTDMVTEAEVRPLSGISRQASASVKGLAEGREAKPSALDDGAYGGSLGKVAIPKLG